MGVRTRGACRDTCASDPPGRGWLVRVSTLTQRRGITRCPRAAGAGGRTRISRARSPGQTVAPRVPSDQPAPLAQAAQQQGRPVPIRGRRAHCFAWGGAATTARQARSGRAGETRESVACATRDDLAPALRPEFPTAVSQVVDERWCGELGSPGYPDSASRIFNPTTGSSPWPDFGVADGIREQDLPRDRPLPHGHALGGTADEVGPRNLGDADSRRGVWGAGAVAGPKPPLDCTRWCTGTKGTLSNLWAGPPRGQDMSRQRSIPLDVGGVY